MARALAGAVVTAPQAAPYVRGSAPRAIRVSPAAASVAWRFGTAPFTPCSAPPQLRCSAPQTAQQRQRQPLRRAVQAQSQQRDAGNRSPQPDDSQPGSLLGSVGLFALWAALGAYAFFVSPNQTPLRDQYFLEKLVGLGSDDGVAINAIFTQLFFIMGVWPLIYTALLIPSGKSRNGVPAWPFLTLSYGIGAFGLLPFMALWQPPSPPPTVPAAKGELEGTGNLMQKGFETPIPAALALAGAVFCIYQAATAGVGAWNEYFRLLEESRFVNVTTVDFLTLTTLAPFWMSNDAELRGWEQRDKLLPILSIIPVLGPAIYLCLRPRAQL